MGKKRFLLLLAVLVLLWGCAKPTPAPATAAPATTAPAPSPAAPEKTDYIIGLCLPDTGWKTQADQLTALLESYGYRVLREYASSKAQLQQDQVQAFVNMPVDCLVVAAIDSVTISDVLSSVSIPVIAYDRLLMYTDGIDGCVAVDSYTAGQLAGDYIIEKKQPDSAPEPVSIEFYMGTPEDNNSLLFYQGVMSRLQPYLDKGTLKCYSGRTAFEDTWVQFGNTLTASDHCFETLARWYVDLPPDVICTGSDALAAGCIDALTSFGLTPEDPWPLITGMGGTESALASILEGYQAMTLYTDTAALTQHCALWVRAVLQGQTLSGQTVSNGTVELPQCTQTPVVLDKDNYEEVLRDTQEAPQRPTPK